MKYTKQNGILIMETPATAFSILMVDKAKKTATAGNYCNAGFFGNYKEGKVRFTLPFGHLVCDYAAENEWTRFYCSERGHLDGDRFSHNGDCVQSTLVISGSRADIIDVSNAAFKCDYAIAGVPVLRGGARASWDEAKKQGWEASSLYSTWHVFVALKKDRSKVYGIGLKSTTGNLVSSGEGYNKLKALGFVDAIKLDGGGSFVFKAGNVTQQTLENRRINTILCFGGNPYSAPTRTLTQGKRGNDVKWLQYELNDRGFACSIDGSFGPGTREALAACQVSLGLTPDGSCGPATRKALLD